MLAQAHIGFPPLTIALFVIAIIVFLAIDLYAHKKDKEVDLKDAIIWSLIWVAVSFAFAGYLYVAYDMDTGSNFASLFLTGYMLEKVLSVDNLMVFVAIFSSFAIPDGYRHRVLFYGVLGAIVFRMIFVGAGSALYAMGPWVEFIFAAIIVWTAIKMLQDNGGEEEIEDYSGHWSVRLVHKFMPVWPKFDGHNFFIGRKKVEENLAKPENSMLDVIRGKAVYATPLFLCLIAIEVSDVLFAFDSVPAVIAVTKEPFLVYSAMIFAILGLRQLYFVLEALQKYLVHLVKAIILLLFFIAFKLCLSASNHLFDWPGFHIDPTFSLIIVVSVLVAGVIASFVFPQKQVDKD